MVGDLADLAYMESVLDAHPVRAEVFVSPVHGANAGPIAARIVEENLPVRFSLQLHKLIGVR